MSKLLLDDKPLIILPSLAAKIGLNESIVLQQLHYWLLETSNIKDGFKWIYNTYEDWQKQFPFWSVSTIRRTITKLENQGLIIIGNYNKLKIDNTKWYRINYHQLEQVNRPPVQNEQTECSEWTDGQFNMNRPLPEITSETTSDKLTTTTTENPVRLCQKSLIRLSPLQEEGLYKWVDDFNSQTEIVNEAIRMADDKNKRYYGFIEYLLKEWWNNRLDSLDNVRIYEQEKFNKLKPARRGASGKNEAAEQFARENGIPF